MLTKVYKQHTIVNMENAKLVIQPKRYREVTSVVSARLPKDMIRQLDRVAENTGYNRNEVIAICLEFAIDHMEGEGKAKRAVKKGAK